MKLIMYTPDAADKLRTINEYITMYYGSQKAKEVMTTMIKSIHRLTDNEKIRISIKDMFGLSCEYRYIFVAKNYIFYLIEENTIQIINIYHEREDFLHKLLTDN